MKLPKFRPGTILLLGGAAFQATQFARAYAHLDPGNDDARIGGWIAGVVVNGTIAYAGTQLPRIRSPKVERWARFAFFALLGLSPLIVAPVNYITMDAGVLGGLALPRVIYAVVTASVMDICLFLAGVIDKELLGSVAPATASDAKKAGQRRSKSLAAKTSDAGAKIYRCECGQTFADRFKYSGHTRTCLVRKEIKSTPIPVELASKKQER